MPYFSFAIVFVDMRLVQLTIPAGERESILSVLDEEGIDYVVSDETSGREYDGVVSFPLPSSAVEPVLDELRDVADPEEAYLVVSDARTVVSEDFSELQERFATDTIEDERISRQELATDARELTPTFSIYATMTLISAIVATAGLLLDSPAVVVGSMVIAPLIGPALSASVGTVFNEQDLFWKGIKYQAIGILIAIVGAAVFAFVLRTTSLVPPGLDLTGVDEIEERLAPDLLSLFVALGAGVAGVLSISTGLSVALVGVMIAAALIPPAAAAGIAIAWGWPMAAVGSTVLVLLNVICVNLAGLLTLWYTGYRPEHWFEEAAAHRETLRNVAVFAVVVLVLSVFLVGVTVTTYQIAVFEDDVEESVEGLLEEPAFEEYELLHIEVELDRDYPFRQQERVIVTVGSSTDAEQPELADAIHAVVVGHADDDIDVQVQYVHIERRGGESAETPPSDELRPTDDGRVSPRSAGISERTVERGSSDPVGNTVAQTGAVETPRLRAPV